MFFEKTFFQSMIPFLFELRKLLHNTLWGSGGAQIRQSYPLDSVTEVGLD